MDAPTNEARTRELAGVSLWIGLVCAVSFLGSWALACVAPLVAIAAIAGEKMRLSSGAALVATAWAMNQAIGYTLLDYPLTTDAVGWGLVIGVSSFAGFAAARFASGLEGATGTIAGFAAAFVAYEAVMFAATAVLPSNGTFTTHVMGEILMINAVAFAGLLALYWSAVALKIVQPAEAHVPAAPAAA